MPRSHPRPPARRPEPSAEPVPLVLDGVTHGGEAVGRLPDGKACFVPYAIPGERVTVVLVEERKRWSRGRVVEVLEASPDRVEAPCPYFGPGRCGGCQLQHVSPEAQPELKRRIVREQLQRIGRISDPPVAETVVVELFGYRNRARFAVTRAGALAFRRAGSHDLIPIDRCLLLAPETQAVRDEAGDAWAGTEEITVRASLTGDERALVVTPGPGAVPPLPPGDLPVALTDARGRAVALRGEPVLSETVAGRRFRVSPTSFFQASTKAAEVLVDLVCQAADVTRGDTALDLHAGVGLFAAALADAGATVTAVEADPVSADDARANLDSAGVEVVTGDAAGHVARLAAEHEQRDIVLLDPPRAGAGTQLCIAVASLDPRVIVYVSCDPASLARDARALVEAGYELTLATPVDQFAQTAHVETVATFHSAYRLAANAD